MRTTNFVASFVDFNDFFLMISYFLAGAQKRKALAADASSLCPSGFASASPASSSAVAQRFPLDLCFAACVTFTFNNTRLATPQTSADLAKFWDFSSISPSVIRPNFDELGSCFTKFREISNFLPSCHFYRVS